MGVAVYFLFVIDVPAADKFADKVAASLLYRFLEQGFRLRVILVVMAELVSDEYRYVLDRADDGFQRGRQFFLRRRPIQTVELSPDQQTARSCRSAEVG